MNSHVMRLYTLVSTTCCRSSSCGNWWRQRVAWLLIDEGHESVSVSDRVAVDGGCGHSNVHCCLLCVLITSVVTLLVLELLLVKQVVVVVMRVIRIGRKHVMLLEEHGMETPDVVGWLLQDW